MQGHCNSCEFKGLKSGCSWHIVVERERSGYTIWHRLHLPNTSVWRPSVWRPITSIPTLPSGRHNDSGSGNLIQLIQPVLDLCTQQTYQTLFSCQMHRIAKWNPGTYSKKPMVYHLPHPVLQSNCIMPTIPLKFTKIAIVYLNQWCCNNIAPKYVSLIILLRNDRLAYHAIHERASGVSSPMPCPTPSLKKAKAGKTCMNTSAHLGRKAVKGVGREFLIWLKITKMMLKMTVVMMATTPNVMSAIEGMIGGDRRCCWWQSLQAGEMGWQRGGF